MTQLQTLIEEIPKYQPAADLALLERAYRFSEQSHQGQQRASGEPYLSHPLEVAGLLVNFKMDVTTVTAGLLHDVLEDTKATKGDLQREFGAEIADLVDGVTKIGKLAFSSREERQAEVAELLFVHRRRRSHHQVHRGLVLGERDDLTDGFKKIISFVAHMNDKKTAVAGRNLAHLDHFPPVGINSRGINESGGEPASAFLQGLRQDSFHPFQLGRSGRSVFPTHDHCPNCSMRHEHHRIGCRGGLIQGGKVFGHGVPGPFLKISPQKAGNPNHHRVFVRFVQGGHRKTILPDQSRRYPLHQFGIFFRIFKNPHIRMGMAIDKPG